MNGKVIFVTYGNEPYYQSLNRLKEEAETTGLFDEILVFTDKDLPKVITTNQLFSHKRGGGYWLWKPWVVLQALMHCKSDDDLVVYSDCGNTVYNHQGWFKLIKHARKYDATYFYNGGRMSKWTRRSVFEYYGSTFKQSYYQIMSGFFLVRRSGIELIEKWYEDMLTHPQLVMDVDKARLYLESKDFVEHRHDQAVLSAIAYTAPSKYRICILPERSERLRKQGQPLYNSRISDDNRRSSIAPSPLLQTIISDKIIKPYRRVKTWFLRNFK